LIDGEACFERFPTEYWRGWFAIAVPIAMNQIDRFRCRVIIVVAFLSL